VRDTERERLHQAAERAADANIHTNKQSKIIQPLSQAVVSTVLIVIVVVAVQHFVLAGALSMALLLTFLFALFRLMPKFHALNHQRGLWAKNRAGLSNVAALIRAEDKPSLDDGSKPARPLQRAIEFDGVSFGYTSGEPVLNDIDLRIEKGETTALVGSTGAGKSTLVDLIPRFYDPTEGRILYDGADLRDFEIASLRERIAVVSQSTHIFNKTAAENIAYGTPEATAADIREAAAGANAREFIEDMENGFQTMLGERGVRVSGGQRQRIAIARALLRDPGILILDEATSDLDSVTEQLVQNALQRLMEDRTVVAIAHRLSTIDDADKVVVLRPSRPPRQALGIPQHTVCAISRAESITLVPDKSRYGTCGPPQRRIDLAQRRDGAAEIGLGGGWTKADEAIPVPSCRSGLSNHTASDPPVGDRPSWRPGAPPRSLEGSMMPSRLGYGRIVYASFDSDSVHGSNGS
jgi:subfamily B ATP-binding cassette protein MsbA